ncbi:uncharacterized protein PV07_05596 [Cladophialophora immunda]|uniref:Heterokaryon incompatibility domain-containing protein n=1 Tax=Cladophialophora immunda TaxID=569365 RepID=A0A0D2D221_9EURO|nr:uncharacterized protein PV07_05596 [Cladophialophora immunda]KIW29809.1 hypothetical protein PV07_05596 [Cladophialophora immunda]OQV08715.1 hypothetical protein CLAIMM_12941 [Cladophialophora immunda]
MSGITTSETSLARPLYSRLRENTIRLLRFKGVSCAKHLNRLHCEIEVAEIGSKEYDAVSYVWGSVEEQSEVVCNEHCVRIPTNLLNALLQIWTELPDRLLWVDALCINQEDQIEKAVQVRLMGPIFSEATIVRAWLGDGPEYSTEAWRELEEWSTYELEGGRLHEEYQDRRLIPQHLARDEETENAFWAAIYWLIAGPWFTRTWIFQEAVLAQHAIVHCGRLSMEWSQFAKGAMNIAAGYFEGPADSHAWDIERGRMLLGVKSSTDFGPFFDASDRSPCCLLDQLSLNWQRNCSNPRDKIYGVLGVLSLSNTYAIKVDYSLPTSQVYADACLACIKVENRIDMLRTAGLENRILDRQKRYPKQVELLRSSMSPSRLETALDIEQNLPSWCPNWYLPVGLRNLVQSAPQDVYPPSSSETKYFDEPVIGIETAGSCLQLRGFVLGHISVFSGQFYLCEIPRAKDSEVNSETDERGSAARYEELSQGSRKGSPSLLSHTSSLENLDGSHCSSGIARDEKCVSLTSRSKRQTWYLERYLKSSPSRDSHVQRTEPTIEPSILLDWIGLPRDENKESMGIPRRRYYLDDIPPDLIEPTFIREGDWLAMIFGSHDIHVLRPHRPSTQSPMGDEDSRRETARFILVQRFLGVLNASAQMFFRHGVGAFPPQTSPCFRTETLDFVLV